MKRFILTVVLCASLLGILSSFLFKTADAAENPLGLLLNLPAPPPPNPQVSLPTGAFGENFFSKNNPPPDDEPIDLLMEYWRVQSQNYNDLHHKVYPSEKVLHRLMREIEKDPKKLGDLLNILPRTERSGKFVKEFYDRSPSGTDAERDYRGRLKRWLKYNTPYFSSELAAEAGRVTDLDDYVTNHDQLVALARVDWDRAGPIVSRLYNNPGQPASRAAALWAMYVHALESGAVSDVDRYRDELKEIVADKSMIPGVRDLALDALSLEREWSGRDEWYLSMMEDETLTDLGRFTGLTTMVLNSPEGKYIDRMITLLDSESIAVRSAAAQNLLDRLDSRREEIVRALSRWLENPKWLKQTQRSGRITLINALTQVRVPESVPGLIVALDEMEQRPISAYYPSANANHNANRVQMAINAATAEVERAVARAANGANTGASSIPTEPYPHLRSSAIEALAFQKDQRAVPALRRILNEAANPYGNHQLVKAIYECGGFTIGEQVAAVEGAAKTVVAGLTALESAFGHSNSNGPQTRIITGEMLQLLPKSSTLEGHAEPANDVTTLLGSHLMSQTEVSDELARAVIDRITSLERSDASLADALRRIVLNWKGVAINALLLRDLKNNKADPTAIVRLLSERKELRERQMEDVSALRTGPPIAVGISACLLEDANDLESMLDAPGDEVKTALLACSRLIRAPLSVEKVARHLQSKDKLLALAAERYLESEDSPQGRRAVLALHPGEAKILGATTAFFPEGAASESAMAMPFLRPLFATVSSFHARQPAYYGEYDGESDVETEKDLRAEVKENADLLGMYSLDENSIRIYKDRAVFSWTNDRARYRERVLAKEEFDNFKSLLAHYKADDLPPFLSCVTMEGCRSRQLVMLGRNGGRRLYVKASSMPPVFNELDRMFAEFRQPPSVIKYRAAKDVPGLELLFADDRLDAHAVWKNGGDFRLLTADKIRRTEIDGELEQFAQNLPEADEMPGEDMRVSKERTRREYENYSWNIFADGAIGDASSQPVDLEFIPIRDNFEIPPVPNRWKARAGTVEIRFDGKVLYKLAAGKLTKIKSGNYSEPVMTPNGRWVVATMYDDDVGSRLVRINLLTNRQFIVQSPEDVQANRAIAFVPSLNRVLVGPFDQDSDIFGEQEGPGVDDGSGYSLLDPETGSIMPARGEVRPLVQQTYRALQPATNPSEYWAAVPKDEHTVIGLYNARIFTLKPLLTLPKIKFDSMNIWVDAPAGKVYFVYEGHLLSAPLPTVPK